MFQFPSNGKGFPNFDNVGIASALNLKVSIPFKRERLSEPVILNGWRKGTFRFNSLQTGKAFRTAPLPNPVTVRAKLAKTKREDFWDFFNTQIPSKTL